MYGTTLVYADNHGTHVNNNRVIDSEQKNIVTHMSNQLE